MYYGMPSIGMSYPWVGANNWGLINNAYNFLGQSPAPPFAYQPPAALNANNWNNIGFSYNFLNQYMYANWLGYAGW